MINLKEISEESKAAASSLSENMEALKHNWLFKSYFEERGYWDAAEYEKEIDQKTEELNQKIELLDRKLRSLNLWNQQISNFSNKIYWYKVRGG